MGSSIVTLARALGVALAAALGVFACTAPAVSGIPAAGSTVQVGAGLTLAPLGFVDEQGRPTGYEAEVVQAVAERLDYDLEWVKTPFEQAFTALQAGKYRFAASGIYMRCARVENTAEFGEFTVPIGRASLVLTVPAEQAGAIRGFDDLAGKRLGVESAGSVSDLLADANASAGFTKEIYPDTNALFLALEEGRVDAALQSEPASRYAIRDRPALAVAFVVEDTVQPYGWLFRAGDPLRPRFDETIDALKADGTIPAIYERWFGVTPPDGDPAGTIVPRVTTETCRD